MDNMLKSHYDEEYDIFSLFEEGKKVKFSVNFSENVVVDIGFDGKAVGLEISEASEVLKAKPSELKNVKDLRLSTLVKGEFYIVTYAVKIGKVHQENEIHMPSALKQEVYVE